MFSSHPVVRRKLLAAEGIMVICKVYISSSKTLQTPASLADLLAVARRNNLRDDITGILCVFDSNFLQVLEGERFAVEATFGRISGDDRHRNVLELFSEPVGERLFGDWSMALAMEDGLNHADLSACRNLRDQALEPAAPAAHRDVVTTLMQVFKKSLR